MNLRIPPVIVLISACLTAISAQSAWRAVEQPELKEALDKTPVLKVETLGEPARGVNAGMVPNRDGKSWDLLQIYFKDYYGPTWPSCH
jgi:hypothetical protein